MKARIEFCVAPPTVPQGSIVIRDVGHAEGRPSITNDAEAVVAAMLRIMDALGDPRETTRVFYIDSDGQMDELVHDGAMFTGFKVGPR